MQGQGRGEEVRVDKIDVQDRGSAKSEAREPTRDPSGDEGTIGSNRGCDRGNRSDPLR